MGVKTTFHDRWVHVGRKGSSCDSEENVEGIRLVNMSGGLEDEGLEDVIPDVFHINVSEVDPVRDKIHGGIEGGPLVSGRDI